MLDWPFLLFALIGFLGVGAAYGLCFSALTWWQRRKLLERWRRVDTRTDPGA